MEGLALMADTPISGLPPATSLSLSDVIPIDHGNPPVTVGGLVSQILALGSTGTVTSLSIVSANGFAGTVANPTTAPAITLRATVTGLIKGNGTAISAAVAGTDYSIGTSALTTGILKSTTTTGALSIAVAGDFPTLNQNTSGTASNVTGIVLGANGGTGIANTGMTITLGGNLTTSGSFASTFTMTGATGVTFPTAGTLATLAGAEALTNKTVNGNTLTSGSWTLTGSASKTLTFSNSITLAGTDSTAMTFPPASASVGYLNIPQNSQSTAYTTVLADSGKHILHPASDANARTFTIDSNANVPYAIGTALTFVNMTSQVLTIAITSDTLILAGTGTTGSRSLAQYGEVTALKITTTSWLISGVGLT